MSTKETEIRDRLDAHQLRVFDEKAELDGRIERLQKFIDGPIFSGLADDEGGLLVDQLIIMRKLSFKLQQRIDLFVSRIS